MTGPRSRMTGPQRRTQLIKVARGVFAERGYDASSIEDIAARANVSKPVVYEHFGGKEGLYAVVVDREMQILLEMVTASLRDARSSRQRLEQVVYALLTYIEERPDGFRILVRDSPVDSASGTYSSLLMEAISQVTHLLEADFVKRQLQPEFSALYAQAMVGMVSVTARWWLDAQEPSKDVVAAHVVNLCWNGLRHLDSEPGLHFIDASPALPDGT